MKRTIYYSDMMNDDFADNGIKRKKLPRDYQYISKDPLRRTADFMLHHFVATPIAYIFQKVVYCEKIARRIYLLRPKRFLSRLSDILSNRSAVFPFRAMLRG